MAGLAVEEKILDLFFLVLAVLTLVFIALALLAVLSTDHPEPTTNQTGIKN